MNYYATPDKQFNNKKTKSTTQNKAQDWICVVCNNLNFSFRKKCNRCKTQTRFENQNQINTAYSHYYYEPKQENNGVKTPLSSETTLFTPKAKSQIHERVFKPKQNDLNICKLAKQYCPKDLQTGLQKQASSSKKQNFANDFWQFINVRDFDEAGQQQQTTQNQEMSQESERVNSDIEKMISRVLIGEK